MKVFSASTWCIGCEAATAPGAAPGVEGVPRYDYVFVIIAENKSFDRMTAQSEWISNLTRLAAQYGHQNRFNK